MKVTRTSIEYIVIGLILFSLTHYSCSAKMPGDTKMNAKLAGCWVGGLIQNDTFTRDLQLRVFTLKPDSSLALSLIYELGPRSRVWEYNTEIVCSNGTLSWLAHKGYLSDNGDTIYVTKNWKGEKSQWMFYRDPAYDEMIKVLVSCKQKEYTYCIPKIIEDGFLSADVNDAGFDGEKIVQLLESIKKGTHGDIHSILLYRHGKLVLEDYFALNGRISGTFVNDIYRKKVHQLSSTTKGIFSVLCGIAIDQGFIQDVNEPIYRYLPAYTQSFSPEKKQIQIKNLLTMTSGWDWTQFGISWNDDRNNASQMYKVDDVVQYVVERQMVAEPGKNFKYSNGDPTVMGVVLRNACSMEIDKFANKNLFRPMGITDYLWSRYPDGSLETDGGLALCSRDLVKIGILMLKNGKLQGEQIVSANWISKSTKSTVKLSSTRGYGYYWQEKTYSLNDQTEKAFYVPGDGGQILVVFPSLEMVIVFTAGNYDKSSSPTYWRIIMDYILPAITDFNKEN